MQTRQCGTTFLINVATASTDRKIIECFFAIDQTDYGVKLESLKPVGMNLSQAFINGLSTTELLCSKVK